MYLTSTGMLCSVGLHSKAACAAMRAGIAAFAELPFKDDAGEAIIGAAVPDLAPDLSPDERLVQMLEPAIRECVAGLNAAQLKRIPILVGLAEPGRVGGGTAFAGGIISKIEQRIGIRFMEGHSRAIPTGRTAGFEALQEARELLENQRVEACLICGVDSYINARSLHWLDQRWRLKHENNSDGVIPGEAAAAVMLRAVPDADSMPPTRLVALGFAKEEATVMAEDPPLLGLGLAAAAKSALDEASIQMHDVGGRISDVTGESYGFKEQALLIARLLRVHREEGFPIWHASEYIGDTGSAAGVIQMIIAFHAFRADYAPGKVMMCFTSADSGDRAAAVLTSNT